MYIQGCSIRYVKYMLIYRGLYIFSHAVTAWAIDLYFKSTEINYMYYVVYPAWGGSG